MAFQEAGLVSLDLSQTQVTEIKNWTFQRCTSLTRVVFPQTLTQIGDCAFHNTRLVSLDLSQTRLWWIAVEAFLECKSLTSIVFPKTLTCIGSAAFSHCYNLTSVTFPDSLENLPVRAFDQCWNLTSVTFPDTFKEIDEKAFRGCVNLSVVLPPKCFAWSDAFENCKLVIKPSDHILELRKELRAIWSQNVQRQGRMRTVAKQPRIELSNGMMDFEGQQSARERVQVVRLWKEIKEELAPNMGLLAPVIFSRIKEGGEKLVKMPSYVEQPPSEKVFTIVFTDLGVDVEQGVEQADQGGESKQDGHINKRMKTLKLRF